VPPPLLLLTVLVSLYAFASAICCCFRCLQPLILLLDTTPCPALPGLVDAATGAELVPGGAALAAAADTVAGRTEQLAAEQRRVALAQLLVGELVLATKEVRHGAVLWTCCLAQQWYVPSALCW
jgi:hypothetical protein